MAMPHASPPRWTRAMVEALPDDGQRYELAYGELLVTPAPGRRHERILLRFFRAIDTYVTAEGLGELFVSHGVVSWDDDSYFLPDLVVIPASESHTDDWAEVQHPLLIIEVLSPSSARHDRVQKRRRFQEAGVPLYGIVDPDLARVEIWTPADSAPRVESDRLTWHPAGAAAPLVLDLPQLFAPR